MSLASPRRPVSPHPGAQPPRSPVRNSVTFSENHGSPARSSRLRRQFSTSKPDSEGSPVAYQQQTYQQPSPRKTYHPAHISRSYEMSNSVPMSTSSHPSRHNSYPKRRNRASEMKQSQHQDPALRLGPTQMRTRPRPPPLNFSKALWDSEQTSETDCSVASSSSPPRSSNASSSVNSSPTASPLRASSQCRSPIPSPRDPCRSPRSVQPYYSQPPLSPIPPSPEPSTPTYRHRQQRRRSSRSPFELRSPPLSPHSPLSPRLPSPSPCRSPSPAPPVGNLARLASRRRSNAVPGSFGMRRRTSNFLELPESDYERQRRYCSLPEHGYNPRHANEIYRLRAFSISPKGALIKHGDHLASRRSRSSAGSTANTSRQASRTSSRGASPHASRSESRDVSPMTRSPVGSAPHHPRSPWSSHQSGLEVDPGVDPAAKAAPEEPDPSTGPRYRVCILGQNATGKTALVNQFLTSEYMNTYDASLDEEFGERSVSVVLDGEESELVFIDHTSGEMSVENTLSTYEPHACVIVYSVVDRDSFNLAEDILGYLWRVNFADGGHSVILVGNKIDMERSRVVLHDEGKKLATSFGAKFIETSAGLQHNVDELLVGVLKQIRLRQVDEAGRSAGQVGVKSLSRSRSRTRTGSSSLASPLHTLQVARDILAKVCLNAKQSSMSKSCENLHVL